VKLSRTQSTLLRLIAQAHERAIKAGFPGGSPWTPSAYNEYLEGKSILVTGSGYASAWRALFAKGLIESYPNLGRYSARITPAGLEAAKSEVGKPTI
jgi:hypothetical protein